MTNKTYTQKITKGFFPSEFSQYFRGFFMPLSRSLMKAGIKPNSVTFMSLILALVTSVLLALDYLWTGLVFGLVTGFADIVDGQLAKEYGIATKFGGILDSTIDRYNEFFVYTGLAFRYYFMNRHIWIIACALVFLGSVMISYIKARAETDGFECKVGRLQRPERLTILAFGIFFRSPGIDIAVAFLAVSTHVTALYRLLHVYRQSK